MLSAKNKIYRPSMLAVGAIIFFLMMAALPTAYADDVDPWVDIPEDEIVDWGEMWGTVIQFQYTYDPDVGNQAQGITWDFGDGSDRSNEWNPQHTYTELGTYIVVQHVTNAYDGFSEDWGYYRFTIMGKPYAEIVMPEGVDPVKVYATKGTAPVMPETNPVLEGYTFGGYYADAEYTVPYDWTIPIDTPVSVYARFSSESSPVVPDDTFDEEPINIVSVAICVFASVVLLAAVYTRRPVLVILALILLVIVTLDVFDVIDISQAFKEIGILDRFGRR